MSHSPRRFRVAVLLVALAGIVLTGCGDQATPQADTLMTATPTLPELVTLGETQPYRERIAQGLGSIVWTSAYSGPTPEPLPRGEDAVRSTIAASAQPLSGVDYASLALPDWVTVTTKLQVAPGDFTGQGVAATEVGWVESGPRWVLYEWQGPEIPQRDDRPIVYRWVYVYALYDMAEARVTRLLASIRGEAHE